MGKGPCKVHLNFETSTKGNLSDILRYLNCLGKIFKNVNINIDITLENGTILADDYEKIIEGFEQAGAMLIKEEKE